MSVLEVDRKGLARKLGRKPKAFIIYELLANAWDENVSHVSVTAEMLPNKPVCRIVVEDDCPEGFADLRSVYTLFRDSKKGDDPTKRGRFELGEKLVIATAIRARITTTKGTIIIEGDERQQSRAKRSAGTIFEGEFRMTREEFAEVCEHVRMLLVPEDIETTFNGEPIVPRKPLHVFEAALQTVRLDDEGNLKPTERKTEVRVYEPLEGEEAHLYEMGIPVVGTSDKWHYAVQQRVPINWERNNVPPGYLKTLRVEVLNAMHGRISEEEATASWVTQAIDDRRCEAAAVKTIVTQRFGEHRVIYDPTDAEGTKIAVSKGYSVITGGAFSKGAWENIRKHAVALPAGQVTPSPKAYHPDGEPENVIPESEWTADMRRITGFATVLFRCLIGCDLRVRIVNNPGVGWAANFGSRCLTLNFGSLGPKWFGRTVRDVEVLDLLLHEYVHHTVSDHLSNEMHETATKLGAKLANLALDNPELFDNGVYGRAIVV